MIYWNNLLGSSEDSRSYTLNFFDLISFLLYDCSIYMYPRSTNLAHLYSVY